MSLLRRGSVSPSLLRFFLVSSSLLVLLCGVCISGMGFYVLYHSSSIAVDREFLGLPTYLTVLGVLVFATSIVGFVCACRQDNCLSGTFLTMVFIAIIGQVVGGALVLALADDLKDKAIRAINFKVFQINKNGNESHYDITLFRSFQQTMHCCGGSGSEDYEEKAKLICCESDPCEPSDISCTDFIKSVNRKYKIPVGLMMIVFGIMHVSSIVSSVSWAKWRKKPILV